MEYAIGIDLHGTLLGDDERIEERLKEPLIRALKGLSDGFSIYLATGNDLSFVIDRVPHDVSACFQGFVLETGAVLSDGQDEMVLVEERVAKRSRELDALLRQRCAWAARFDRRLTASAIFTKEGDSPRERAVEVEAIVSALGYDDDFYTTYSSVAVDVVPQGVTKMTGLAQVAGNARTIGIADSMNDIHLHLGSDISFTPANMPAEVRESILASGRKIAPLEEELIWGATYASRYRFTEGVIDILARLPSLGP